MFADIFLVHDKVNHIDAFAVGLAVAAETVAGIGLWIDLQTGCTVAMKGTTQTVVIIGVQSVRFQQTGKA